MLLNLYTTAILVCGPAADRYSFTNLGVGGGGHLLFLACRFYADNCLHSGETLVSYVVCACGAL